MITSLEVDSKKDKMFSNKDLWVLFIPLIIEQGLEYVAGLADSIMVASVVEYAVSGVSLIDFLMAFLISIFVSFTTGGGIITAQYLGRKDTNNANKTVRQFVKFTFYFSIIITVLMYFSKTFLLRTIFGSITPDVEEAANIYFLVVVSSIPFLALYNSGATVFRTMNNSKLPMKIMLYMNILNIVGNFVLVLIFKMGVIGVAIPTLVSRVGAALIMLFFSYNPELELSIYGVVKEKFDFTILKRVLNVGLPFGFENGMFYFGRILVLSVVSLFGTAAIAANAVSGTLALIQCLPGISIILGLSVIISKCVGENDYEQAKYYKKKVEFIIRISFFVSSLIVLGAMPLLMNIYNLSKEATNYVWIILIVHMCFLIIMWPSAYMLPVVFRSAGDAKFPMYVSVISMILFRIVFAYVFAIYFNMGMLGTWAAMFLDWIIKGIVFEVRYLRNKWMNFKAI